MSTWRVRVWIVITLRVLFSQMRTEYQTHSAFTARGSTRCHCRCRRRRSSGSSLPLYPSLDLRFSLLLCREFPLFDNNFPHLASHLCIFPVAPLDLLIQLPFCYDHLVFPARFGATYLLPPIRI